MKILFLMLLFISSCSSVVKPVTYTASLGPGEYKVKIEETADYVTISTEITNNKEMKLDKVLGWTEKVFSGKLDKNGEVWNIENDSMYWIEEVLLAPFYSVYANGFFQQLDKHPTQSHLRPNCPLNTKKILVLSLGNQGFPLVACLL